MNELQPESIIRIESFNPEQDLGNMANLYANAYAGPPWNEYTRCTGCMEFYGQDTQPGDCCKGCNELLALAYPKESTMGYITEEGNRPDGTIITIKEGDALLAFAWGFSYESTEEFVSKKYRTDQMKERMKEILAMNNICEKFFYISECCVAQNQRGKGLSNILVKTLLRQAKAKGLPTVMRTNWASPMMAVAETFGMKQVMGPRVRIDRLSRKIEPTGEAVNNFLDSEIEERVLFVVQ